jgi:hypothetical protein
MLRPSQSSSVFWASTSSTSLRSILEVCNDESRFFIQLMALGLPTKQAFKELDYAGAILFILSATLILVGIVYTTTLPSNDPKVIGTLASGFGCLVIFIFWESFAPLKQPLTPTHVFTRDKGRELTAPFIVGFVVTMFYYAINVIYPTMISVFFTDATTDFRYGIVLTLPQNLGRSCE